MTSENNPDLWLKLFPFPKSEGNKYTRGHALIYGGPVMTGAARLAARAAQRIGAGLVTIATPEKTIPIYAENLESVIVHSCDNLDTWRELVNEPKRTAILVGPGMGIGDAERQMILLALETRKPCVLDADALSGFAGNAETLFAKLHDQCVLTPHDGEFARLFGSELADEKDKTVRTRKAAALAGCTVLLKGAETVIAAPDGQMIINRNAPPWLATAGAGDVLAGMILGLVTQHMPVFMATAAAAWLHGKVATDFGLGLIAEDLISGLPKALEGLSELSKGI